LSVATRFLMDVEFGGDDIQSRVVEFMATSHESVDAMGEEYIYIYVYISSQLVDTLIRRRNLSWGVEYSTLRFTRTFYRRNASKSKSKSKCSNWLNDLRTV